MRFQTFRRQFFTILLILFSICILPGEPVYAAEQPIAISSCKLNKNGTKLTIKAKIKEKTDATKSTLYLLGLDANIDESAAISAVPLASGKSILGSISFSTAYDASMLFQKYAIAYETEGTYRILSNTGYITNPEVLAAYTEKSPKAASKKGLQVEDYSEALELGTKHAVLNWTANTLLTDNTNRGIPYEYRGQTYYFNPDVMQANDMQVAGYTKAGVSVSVILLLPNDTAAVTAPMRYDGSAAKYSSFHTSTPEGCRLFEAMMSFLAEHYGTEERLVSGWILGNEVNSPGIWNYSGDMNLNPYISDYARAFRICHNAVKSVNQNAAVYISLDHNWNYDIDGIGNQNFSTKSVLDTFYETINSQGSIVFHIAYHCYPQNLLEASFWNDSQTTTTLDTPYLTFKNLTVLTDYIKTYYGEEYTIMLSEQSFNTNVGEYVQAAAYAYAYYLCESNPMIEAFIYGRQFDHPTEMADGCYWGLSDSHRNKRLIWDVFQYIDSRDSLAFTDPLIQYTNLSSWSDISNFQPSAYENMPSLLTPVKLGAVVPITVTNVSLYWSEISSADGYEVYRNDQKIASIPSHSILGYNDYELTPGSTYEYKVRMYKLAPSPTDPTAQVALYGDFSEPQKIRADGARTTWADTSCLVSGNEITLNWNSQEKVAGYEIARCESANGEYIRLARTNDTTYTDSTAEAGKFYYYKIRTYIETTDKRYFAEFSEPLCVQALIGLEGDIEEENLVFSWDKWPSAVTYEIYCAAENGDYVLQDKVTEPDYSCMQYKDASNKLRDFIPGASYEFRVRAILSDGSASPYSNSLDFMLTGFLNEEAEKAFKEKIQEEIQEETSEEIQEEISTES